jgi:hypothetical protein
MHVGRADGLIYPKTILSSPSLDHGAVTKVQHRHHRH